MHTPGYTRLTPRLHTNTILINTIRAAIYFHRVRPIQQRNGCYKKKRRITYYTFTAADSHGVKTDTDHEPVPNDAPIQSSTNLPPKQ